MYDRNIKVTQRFKIEDSAKEKSYKQTTKQVTHSGYIVGGALSAN